METVTIDHEKCTLCGLCINVCVKQILHEQNRRIDCIDPDRCIFCGHCKAICPVDAVRFPHYQAAEFITAPARENYPSPSDLLAFLRARRSVRIYKSKPVEEEKIDQIIQAGRFAPTGGNRQCVEYVVIHSPDKVAELRNMTIEVLKDQADGIARFLAGGRSDETTVTMERYMKTWQEMYRLNKKGIDRLFYYAPSIIVCHFASMGGSSEIIDTGLASMQMVLMAEALELGTCFNGFFVIAAEKSPALKAIIGIPEDHLVPVAFTVGYPGVKYQRLVSRRLARVTWI